MEILSFAGSLIISFVIFYAASVGTIVVLFKLFFKSIPDDELIETKDEIVGYGKVKRNKATLYRPRIAVASR